VFKRSIEPYVDRVIDGCNVNIIVFGTTESGKSLLLEGSERSSTDQRGIIHYALEDIFDKLHALSIKVCTHNPASNVHFNNLCPLVTHLGSRGDKTMDFAENAHSKPSTVYVNIQ
jgi:hypothetical protein